MKPKKRKAKTIELSPDASKYWSAEAKKNGNKFKPFIENMLELEKFIIYFNPHDKKIQKNQFHVEAPDMAKAKEILKENGGLTYTVIGVKNYPENHKQHFKNLTFF